MAAMKSGELNLHLECLQAPGRRRALLTARDLALTAVAVPAWAVAQAPAAPPMLVAMHGFADQQSITLWLQGRSAMRLRVETRRAEAPASEAPRTDELELDAAADATAQLRLGGLQPGTAYRYRVLDREARLLAEGGFRTQALWQWRSDPPTLRLALGSCAYLNDGIFDRPGPPYGGGE
jgi:alkaline phosphatase D